MNFNQTLNTIQQPVEVHERPTKIFTTMYVFWNNIDHVKEIGTLTLIFFN